MKLLYISKKRKGINWSDSIDLLREDLGEIPGVGLIKFEIDTGGVGAYLGNSKRLKGILEEGGIDVILVHHIICAWPILGLLKKFKGLSIIALHETEPVLGYGFLIKNIFRMPLKHWIRFPGFWNSKPLAHFDQAWILSERQALFGRYSNKYRQVNFLGVDEKRFLPKKDFGGEFKGFFPFGPERREKGFDIVKKALDNEKLNAELMVGGDIPFEKMPKKYQDCHFVVLPTLYETYSLVVLEALASNLFLIAGKEVGLIAQLRKKYSEKKLNDLGIFPVERTVNSIREAMAEIKNRIRENNFPRTREFLEQEGFGRKAVAERVYSELESSLRNGERNR